MAHSSHTSEQYMSSNQDVAQDHEMKDWLDAKLDSDPTYQAILQEYADFLQALEVILGINSIFENTARKEIAHSTLSTEQKLSLTTTLSGIQRRRRITRKRLRKLYTRDILRLRKNAAKEELNNEEVIHGLSNKRTWSQKDRHSRDQYPELTTKHESEDQQFEAEEDSESSEGSTTWKDMSPDVEVKGKKSHSVDEAEGLEYQTQNTQLFVEEDNEITAAPPMEQESLATAEVTYPCYLCVVDPSVPVEDKSKLYKWTEFPRHTREVHDEYLK